jgi:outer membrane protein TolC
MMGDRETVNATDGAHRSPRRKRGSGLVALACASGFLALSIAVLSQPSGAAAEGQIFPIDLPTALRLAERGNPTIAIAREAICANLAVQQQARALLLPTLNAGTNLHIHTGNLQNSTGEALQESSQSLYFGGGAEAIAAGTVAIPAVSLVSPLGDALYQPLVAQQRVAASRFDCRAASNAVLLEVATDYLALLGAEAGLEALRQTDADAAKIVQAMEAFVQVGQARKADADRAQSRALLIRTEMYGAEEQVAVAAARLAALLDLDPAVGLEATSGPLQPVPLVDPGYDLENLIAIALGARPEMGSQRAAIAAGEARLQAEKMRPLLPTISAGFSAGDFGAGSDLGPVSLGQFAPRSDFDVLAVWTLQNAGLGNLALQRRRRAEVEQAVSQRVRVINLIREEVSAAYGTAAARCRQIQWAQQQLATAQSGFREELTRIRGGEGLPIEAVNSLDLLARARLDAITAVVEYNQAEFRLFVSLGAPPPAIAIPDGNASPSAPQQP